jgi:Flp pilus assembly protein TadG
MTIPTATNRFERNRSTTMNARLIRRQRGQAMSEFAIAMIAFVPLVLGVIYIGKYSDIKHQAIQASRYAAFERALDPHSHEGGTTVQDETVARFFRDGGQHAIGFQDKATGSTRSDENPVWAQVNDNPMIGQYPDVSVQFSSKSVKDSTTSTLMSPMDLAIKTMSGLNDDGSAVEADVSVKVANISHFATLSNINLSVGATTVIAGDPWNGGGAQDVANHFPSSPFPPPAVPQRVLGWLENLPLAGSLLNLITKLFVDTGLPQFGCVKPDVVPDSVAPGANYDPMNGGGVNQCY